MISYLNNIIKRIYKTKNKEKNKKVLKDLFKQIEKNQNYEKYFTPLSKIFIS